MLPKIIRTGIHRCEGTGVRKTEMATQYRKAYVPVTLDVDKEGAILPRLIWWDNGVIFQIDQILYKCRATSKRVGGGGITDSLGKRKTKWISTGLTVKGNKKRAEAILMDARRNFNPEEPKVMNGDILFADYMEKWLDIIKSSVAVPTFASYSTSLLQFHQHGRALAL